MTESPDGTRFLYYDDGVFFAYDMASGKSIELTRQIPATFWDTEDDHNVVKPPTQSYGWSKDSSAVLLSDGWDIWKVPVQGGKAVNLTVNGKKDKIRYKRPFRLDPEEKGIDLSAPIYVPMYGEWTKKGGIGVIEPGKPGIRMLQWDDAAFTQFIKAKKADTYSVHARDRQRVSRLLRDGRLAGARTEDHRRQSAAEGFPVVERCPAGRLHQHARRQAAGRAVAAGRITSRARSIP